jgi:hypothetical protein
MIYPKNKMKASAPNAKTKGADDPGCPRKMAASYTLVILFWKFPL